MTQKNERDGEPLTVWSDFQVFLDLCPAFYLYRIRKNKVSENKKKKGRNGSFNS